MMILVKRKYWSSSFVNVRFLLAIQISGNNEMASMSRSTPFPRRLFNMVASESKAGSKVVMWSDDGRAFFVQDEHSFIEEILPKHGFKASKIASFQRNLNIYGFQRMTRGAYIGGYVHQRFHRGMSESELSKITRREPKTSIPTEVSSDNLGQLVAQGGKPAVLKPPKIAVSGEILLNKSPSSGIYRETETPTVEASALLSLQQKASSSAQVSPIGVEKL